jgi:hypothetical protein
MEVIVVATLGIRGIALNIHYEFEICYRIYGYSSSNLPSTFLMAN